ncbi:MAG: SPFH domain-containing protein [Streptococcaceae bacterium]|jgi:regulator of protease activity HflC (stomatin/prohibitin superfamily)|nr:SPFH domain-containing protein [Streptococcaceae bacterium]
MENFFAGFETPNMPQRPHYPQQRREQVKKRKSANGGFFYIVPQQSAVILERFGKFQKIATAGLYFKIPVIDNIAATIDLRVNQKEIQLETKTKDNVFVKVSISTQFRVDPTKIDTSFYELQNPVEQIKSYIEDAIRSAVPTLTLDEAFERKEDIALNVQETVGEGMSQFGYIIIKTLVTAIDPAEDVKESMNSINAAQRQRVAAQELAEADRIRIVTAAKAEAEKAQLQGEGLANQRRAIVDGLAKSFEQLADSGISEKEIMSVLMINQYLDTMTALGKSGASTIFLPNSPEGIEGMRNELITALKASEKTTPAPKV